MRIGLLPSMLGVCLWPLLSACEITTAPQTNRAVGIVEWQPASSGAWTGASADGVHPEHAVITAPDTVEAGVPFTATITTLGLDSCWKPAGAEVELSASLATVTPYDSPPAGEGLVCAQAITELPRSVELRFTRSGDATIRVVGRRVVGSDLQHASKVTVEKSVHVR